MEQDAHSFSVKKEKKKNPITSGRPCDFGVGVSISSEILLELSNRAAQKNE